MPRSVLGTYTLAPGVNPVVGGTVITDTWANNTLNDMATAMTDSLSRSGKGGMAAPLLTANGAVAAPAVAMSTDTSTGLYGSPGIYSVSISGSNVFTWNATGVISALPITGVTAAAGADSTLLATTAFVQHPDSPAMTGTPTAPTAAPGTATTQVATTAFVSGSFAPLASPALTGTPTAPTAAPGTATTQIATTEFVADNYAPLASPALTGVPTGPTAAPATSTTQLATTEFVMSTAFSLTVPDVVDWASYQVFLGSWACVNNLNT